MALRQNIIYIYFKGKHLVTSKSQYQYNHGQFLYFADLDLPQAFEVHFSSRDRGESKTQIGSDKLVEIPDEYFWNGALQIYAWIYLHSQVNDGETVYEVKIPLIKRAKPTDEEPLPVQQSTIDRAIAELNNAVDITTENANKTDSDKIIVSNIKENVITLKENIDSTAITINQKAQETINASERAEASAQNAATSERKALDYSQQAEQSAQSALESKNIAQQKSEVAINASNEALGYKNEALDAKNQAEQAKQNIVDYRDETKGYRNETLSAKNDVQTLKGQIEDISNTVNENAQSASQSANSANQSALSANQSASNASQSASQAEQFKNQSGTNVTHYPKVVNNYWYVWDAVNEEYVNTNVDARGTKGNDGEDGNGISSAVLNNDYTLTLTFTDGTTYTTPSIRGEKGEQGEPATDMDIHICSSNEYDSETRIPTITSPDDKTFYLVPTVDGTSPDLFTEWVYVNNAWEMFGSMKIDLSGYLTDATVNGTSIVNEGVAEIPIASNTELGVVKANESYGYRIVNGFIRTKIPSANHLKIGANTDNPLTTAVQHTATFYGLAKVAGHDEKDSTLPVGQYTDEAKASIQSMLGVPSEDEVVTDVQINGSSIVQDGVAEIPVAIGTATLGLMQTSALNGIRSSNNGTLSIFGANVNELKAGTHKYNPVVASTAYAAVFYGLAKASGDTTQSQSSNAVGNYTDNAKDKIQTMLGVSPLIAPHESDPFESAHAIGELFIINGKLYRAKTALTVGEYINEGTNVEVVDVAEVLDDTYVKNTDIATSTKAGVVKASSSYGVQMYGENLQIVHALDSHIKTGSGSLAPYRPITPDQEHAATFYGLAKAAGDTTQSQSDNAVGTYTDEAKTAIKQMLGVHDTYDSFIEEVTGTDVTITGQPSYRYNCGELYSLTVTPPESGTIDFRFTSGSTPTVLTLPQTVKMPEWWVEVEANTIYEMCITDGIYCGVMTWAI